MSMDQPQTAAELQRRAEEHRENVSEDLQALERKLSPDNVKREVKEAVSERVSHVQEEARDASRRFARGASESVRNNPVPLALIGAGVGWLIYDAYSRSRDDRGTGRGGVQRLRDRARETTAELGNRARRTRAELGEQAQAASNELGQRAQEVKGRAMEVAREGSERAAHLSHEARDQAVSFYESNPLAVGGLALAAGIGVAMLLPPSRPEDETIGPYREQFIDRSKQEALETKHAAERAVGDAVSGAQDEAERRMVDPKGLEQRARDLAGEAKGALDKGVEHGKESFEHHRSTGGNGA